MDNRMFPTNNQIWILIGIAAIITQVCSISEKQIQMSPPVPGLPENTDPTSATTTTKLEPDQTLLSNSYLPAVMQAVAYYVELIQYEPQDMTTIEPPYTLAGSGLPAQSEESTTTVSTTERTTQRPTYSTTTRHTPRPTWYSTTSHKPLSTATITIRPTTRPTYQTARPTYQTARPTYQTAKPTQSSSITTRPTQIPWYLDQTTSVHNPGYYQPSNPLYDYPEQSAHRPSKKPQTGNLPLLSISHSQFFDWFLQMKTKELSEMSEYDLQFLHQLPSGLLQDILYERYEQPAFLDKDNVNEFLKVYDDFYGRNQPVTGKKKVPPTKPYVQLLMLYDLLKREAKKLMLNKFQGYAPEMIEELNQTAQGSAERQLHTLLYRMITRKDVDKPDVNVRVATIIEDLINPASTLAMSLRYIPPLAFLP